MSTFKERRIDAASHPEELDAFKNQKPPTMNRINPLISRLHQEDAWVRFLIFCFFVVILFWYGFFLCLYWFSNMFSDDCWFLGQSTDRLHYMEFDPTTGKVLHFGFFYCKIFRHIGKILYLYHKNRQFCGDVISWMMVSQNLDVFHPYDGGEEVFWFRWGKKTNVRHFGWLLALVVKT